MHTENGTSHKFRIFFVFLRKDEVITLQSFVSLSFFQHGGISLIGEHSPNSLCFVMPEDGKIILVSFFCSNVNIFRMTAVLWYCVKTPLLPSPSPVLLLMASQYISPSAKENETKRGLPCSGCQIHFQCGWSLTVGLCHDCPNNQIQAAAALETEVVLH